MLMRTDVANASSGALADDRMAVAQPSTYTRWRDWWSGSDRLDPALQRAARSDDPSTVGRAAAALGDATPSPKAQRLLVQLGGHASFEVRREVAKALGKFPRAHDSVRVLRTLCDEEYSFSLQIAAARSLLDMAGAPVDVKALQTLKKLAAPGELADIRRDAVAALVVGSVLPEALQAAREVAPDIDLEENAYIEKLGLGLRAHLAPTEQMPERMLGITGGELGGTYIGVGTERCFMTVALHPRFSQIIMADFDPRVRYYNEINIGLLRASEGRRAAYLHLRLSAGAVDWADKVQDLPQRIGTNDPYTWWRGHVRYFPKPSLEELHEGATSKFYGRANYLSDDVAFQNVYAAARTGRMSTMFMDLRDPESLRLVGEKVRDPIGMLDLSNCWRSDYVGAGHVLSAAAALAKRVDQNTLLLQTTYASFVEKGRSWQGLTYLGSSLQTLLRDPAQGQHWVEYLGDLESRGDRMDMPGEVVERMDAHRVRWWQRLGVAQTASIKEIDDAYERAKSSHPTEDVAPLCLARDEGRVLRSPLNDGDDGW